MEPLVQYGLQSAYQFHLGFLSNRPPHPASLSKQQHTPAPLQPQRRVCTTPLGAVTARQRPSGWTSGHQLLQDHQRAPFHQTQHRRFGRVYLDPIGHSHKGKPGKKNGKRSTWVTFQKFRGMIWIHIWHIMSSNFFGKSKISAKVFHPWLHRTIVTSQGTDTAAPMTVRCRSSRIFALSSSKRSMRLKASWCVSSELSLASEKEIAVVFFLELEKESWIICHKFSNSTVRLEIIPVLVQDVEARGTR